MSPGKLRLAWRIAVGSAIDRATTVSLLDGGTVEVFASELPWRREVRRSEAVILSRLRDLVGADCVARIKVVTRPSKG